MNFPALPSFDALPPEIQQRIDGLAQRFGLTHPQAMALIMLVTKGLPDDAILASCRKSGIALKRPDLRAIREEIDLWITVPTRREKVKALLEARGLLTEERRKALDAATTPAAIMAIYFEATPLPPGTPSQLPTDPAWSWWGVYDALDARILIDIFGSETFSTAVQKVWETASGLAEGAGDLLSNAWESVDLSSLFDWN